MTRLFCLRPEPGFSATVAAARACGIAIAGEPLARIRPVEWTLPPSDSFDALLLGSANAVRDGGELLEELRGKRALVVGAATAAAARDAGFDVAMTGEGGLQALLDRFDKRAGCSRLLRLAGARHVPLDPPDGVSIATRVVYRAEYLPLSRKIASTLSEGGVVLLHSAEMARHFAASCDGEGILRDRLAIAALAPRIAQAAGDGWRRIEAAAVPTDEALLAMARDMCQ